MSAREPASSEWQALRRKLRMLERRLGGAPPGSPRRGKAKAVDAVTAEVPLLGAVALPLDGGPDEVFSYRGDTQFPAASTIKVYVLQAAFEAVAAGRLALDQEVELTAADQVGGTGVLDSLSPGRRYTVLDLATLMIVVSDNTATNLLIELLGVEGLNASIRRNGFTGTLALGKLMMNKPPPPTGPRLSQTTPADLASYFARLWRGELLPDELGEIARGIYGRQQYSFLGRKLAYDRYAGAAGEGPIRISSKTGSIRGVRNDAGVIEPLETGNGRAVVIAVMSSGCFDLHYGPDNAGEQVLARAGHALYQALR